MNTSSSNNKTFREPKPTVPITRRALAAHYFPSPTPASSVRRLSRWLADDPDLRTELESAGYKPCKQWITRRQLDIFVKYFGW